MATYNEIYVTTKATKENKNLVSKFKACKYQKLVVTIPRLAGKIKEYVEANAIEYREIGWDYNGYGWSNHDHCYLLTPANAKKLLEIIEGKKATAKKPKTEAEIIEAWSKRLAKLTGISIEEAKTIAEEKLEYKRDRIDEVESRQYGRYSVKRASLIRKMERENPLRRIEDADHAQRILAASRRHNDSDYEALLDEYRFEAECGNIDKSEVRDMARMNMSYAR